MICASGEIYAVHKRVRFGAIIVITFLSITGEDGKTAARLSIHSNNQLMKAEDTSTRTRTYTAGMRIKKS